MSWLEEIRQLSVQQLQKQLKQLEALKDKGHRMYNMIKEKYNIEQVKMILEEKSLDDKLKKLQEDLKQLNDQGTDIKESSSDNVQNISLLKNRIKEVEEKILKNQQKIENYLNENKGQNANVLAPRPEHTDNNNLALEVHDKPWINL